MKILKKILVTTFKISLALSVGLSFFVKESNAIEPCRNFTAPDIPVGTECITAQGFVFKLESKDGPGYHKESWKDLKSGIVWRPWKRLQFYSEALSFCLNRGQNLPSKSEVEIANSHGFQEIMRATIILPEQYFLWTSTKSIPGGDCCRGGPYVFDRLSNEFCSHGEYFYYGAFRCISR